MSWKEKYEQTSFEQTELPIHGLFFLDGDVIARVMHGAGTEGFKYPMVAFPSGEEFSLWDVGDTQQGIIHLFGEMDLPLRSTRDEAALQAKDIADMLGYAVRSRGENQLDVWGQELDDRYTLTYDNSVPIIIDIASLREVVEPPVHPAHVLMNDELRSKLPPYRSIEQFNMETQAVVKYFTPDVGWTWYAAAFDGEDTLYGLVAGYEVEFGPFTLSELSSMRGGLNLPVERDLHFQPATLGELYQRHRRERSKT